MSNIMVALFHTAFNGFLEIYQSQMLLKLQKDKTKILSDRFTVKYCMEHSSKGKLMINKCNNN